MDSFLTNACKIKIDNFEGPFDLLFHLIEKNKFNIYDIPINEITDQYMEYLFAMEKMDLDIAGEFLVMAATLLHIKSRLMLPIKKEEVEEEEDPREALIMQLIQYKMHKESSQKLRERNYIWSKAFYRFSEIHETYIKNDDLELTKFIDAMARILKLSQEKVIINNTKKIDIIVKREKISLVSKIKQIMFILRSNTFFKFSDFFSMKEKSVGEVVTGFLALLELSRSRHINLEQRKQFEEIYVYKNTSHDNSEILYRDDKYEYE